MKSRYSHASVNETKIPGIVPFYGVIKEGDESVFLKVLLKECSLKQQVSIREFDPWGDTWTFPGDLFFSGKVVGDFSYSRDSNLINPEIEKVIFNDPATVVYWKDGTKTVVKAQDGEPFDKEKGLAMAIVKKVYGNKGSYNEIFKEFGAV